MFCDESYEVLIWKKQICCWFLFDWGNGSIFDKTKSWSWTVGNDGKQFEGTGDSFINRLSLTVWIFRPFKLHRPTMDHNCKAVLVIIRGYIDFNVETLWHCRYNKTHHFLARHLHRSTAHLLLLFIFYIYYILLISKLQY